MVETVMLTGGGVTLREVEEMELKELVELWLLVQKLGMMWRFGIVPEEERERVAEEKRRQMAGFEKALARSVRQKEIYDRLMRRLAERN